MRCRSSRLSLVGGLMLFRPLCVLFIFFMFNVQKGVRYSRNTDYLIDVMYRFVYVSCSVIIVHVNES